MRQDDVAAATRALLARKPALARPGRPPWRVVPSNEKQLTHLSGSGEARMVDVSGKPPTERVAVAEGYVIMQRERRSTSCARAMRKKATCWA